MIISVELNDEEAQALAQFIKRAGFYDARNKALSDDEAYLMLKALSNIRRELNAGGFDPR